MNYENYLSYSKAIQEATGHLVDWPDTNPVEDSVQPVTEDTTQDSEQEDQTSEPEE